MGNKFAGGLQSFGQGVLGAVPGMFNGAIAGMSAGPEGAAAGALAGLIPGLSTGVSNAVKFAQNPQGPQSAQQAFGSLGSNAVQSGGQLLNSRAFGRQTQSAAGAFNKFNGAVRGGSSMRSAMMQSGGSAYPRAASDAATSSLGNKVSGMAGVNPISALASTNGYFRNALGSASKSSVHFNSINSAILSAGHALAGGVMGSTLQEVGRVMQTAATQGATPNTAGAAAAATQGSMAAEMDPSKQSKGQTPPGAVAAGGVTMARAGGSGVAGYA